MSARNRDKEAALTPEMVRELFSYNRDTGALNWARPPRRGVAAGPAGCRNSDGYLMVGYRGHEYMGIHVIWCWMTGSWPANGIDHRDRISTNDRWDNLREASYSQNNMNMPLRKDNTTGVRGVGMKKSGTFVARIRIGGKQIYLGDHRRLEDAAAARAEAEMRLFGEFSPLSQEAA